MDVIRGQFIRNQHCFISNHCIVTFLLIGFGFISCAEIFISDFLLPENVKIVSTDYELYDGRSVVFSREIDSWPEKFPSSLSGRKLYRFEDLNSKNGIVEGEYKIDHGRYIVIRLADDTLVKVPKEVFLVITEFTDANRDR